MQRVGALVGGRYRIVQQVGRGGHGEVYRAQQLPLGREVAVKMLLPEAYSGDTPERFAREAALVQTLDHPNTVRLFDFGVDENGFPFMVFELLRGKTLEEEIANSGPMPPERVARIATQTLKALMDAHARGIIHRDVKPSNVMLVDFAGEKDFVKVLDFGVARRAVESTAQPKITSDGQIVGTPAYMAPEQVKDQPIGPATDLYSLGLVIAEALSGEMVVRGSSEAEIWMKQASAAPVNLSPRVLASAFGPVVARATNKDPANRYSSAEEMLRAIEHAMSAGNAPTDALARPVVPPAPRPRLPPPAPAAAPLPSSSWPKWAVALIGIAAVLMVVSYARSLRRVQRAVRVENPNPNPFGETRATAPPMPRVVEQMTALGWKPIRTPDVKPMPFFVVTTFVFERRNPDDQRLIVFVWDFDEESQAIDEERRQRASRADYGVRRRLRRVVVVDDDKHGAADKLATQLLP